MEMSRAGLWRVFFILTALFIVVGGPQHPKGTMGEMLANPKWIPSHALLLAGFVAFLIGLLLYQRGVGLPDRTRRWVRLAVVATILQSVEMALHTAAAVDHANLMAGRTTPVLTTHLWMAVIVYPIFGLTLAGFILATARDRALGSTWIGVRILGVCSGASRAARGASGPGADILFFPCFAVWRSAGLGRSAQAKARYMSDLT
jgi:hypothetical protein